MDVAAYIAERAPLVERFLDAEVPAASEPPAALHGAMRHLLFPGGKRFRPMLSFAAAEAVGAPPEAALPMAGAVELVHTYSLIHDDLPCMDDDVQRRGRATVHVAFDEALAVLAGDALLAEAFRVLCAAPCGASASQRLAAARDLARAAGSRHLVGGQADDLRLDATSDAHTIEAVHRRKTAALIEAAVVGGARLAGADDALLARLGSFARAAGLGFQIADDVLDEACDGASSLVRVVGVEKAREQAEALLAAALQELAGLGEAAEPLRELARYAVRRDR